MLIVRDVDELMCSMPIFTCMQAGAVPDELWQDGRQSFRRIDMRQYSGHACMRGQKLGQKLQTREPRFHLQDGVVYLFDYWVHLTRLISRGREVGG